jgi:hypothetical protein
MQYLANQQLNFENLPMAKVAEVTTSTTSNFRNNDFSCQRSKKRMLELFIMHMKQMGVVFDTTLWLIVMESKMFIKRRLYNKQNNPIF